MESLDRFLAAESRLKAATQEFLESCSALHNLHFDSNQSSAVQDESHAKIEQIRACKDSLTLTKNKISESQIVLDTVLRRFPPLAAALGLPAELLSTIFKHAVPPTCRWVWAIRPNTLLAIASVCRRWRGLAIQTPPLWSHIDFYLTDYDDNPRPPKIEQLWLERAKGSSLHVHFLRTSDEFKGRYTPKLVALPRMIAALAPYSSQIITLRFANFEAKHLIETLAEIRLAQGATNLVTALDHSGLTNSYPYSSTPIDTRPTPPWSPALFKGLSELLINNLPQSQCPTLSELVAILDSCPKLRSLQLRSIAVREDASVSSYPIVQLPELRYLNLRGIYERGQPRLLSILRPGRAELHLEISVATDNADAFAATTKFMSTFRVASLCLWHLLYDEEYDTPIAPYFQSAQSIHTLHISLEMRSMSNTIDSLITTTRRRNLVKRLPNLKALVFTGGRIYPDDVEPLKRLVTLYSLNKLVLAGCERRTWNEWSPQAEKQHETKYHEMLEWIKQRVPEVVLTANDTYDTGLP